MLVREDGRFQSEYDWKIVIRGAQLRGKRKETSIVVSSWRLLFRRKQAKEIRGGELPAGERKRHTKRGKKKNSQEKGVSGRRSRTNGRRT